MIRKFKFQVFSSFNFFYDKLGLKIWLLLISNFFVGIFDCFGIAMFFPLLSIASEAKSISEIDSDEFLFFVETINKFNIDVSVINVLLIMIIFFILKGIFTYIVWSYRVFLQQKFIREIRFDFIEGINSISYDKFISSDTGNLQNTMTSEIERISTGFTDFFKSAQFASLVFVYAVASLYLDFQFALVVISLGFFSQIVYLFIFKYTKGASRKITVDSGYYQGLVLQYLSNFKYLKATGVLLKFSEKLKKNIFKIEKSRRKIGNLSAIATATKEPLMVIIIAISMVIQLIVFKGSIESIIVSLVFFYRALGAVTLLQNSYNRYLSIVGSIENMIAILDELIFNHNSKLPFSKNKKFKKLEDSIELSNISLSLNNKKILNNISLKIKKNNSIAIVGESGSGKTSLVNIITGLHEISGGSYFIDDYNFNDIILSTFQNKIGYVSQEAPIFTDSIFNNVTLWDKYNKNNIDKFKNVIKLASIHHFVNSQPNKEKTELTSNGTNLSGGQRQRLSIARELYKNIEILIFDEATSALDSETEKIIQKNIDNLKGSYTIIVIAHRISTIKNSDLILELKNGEIISRGTYSNLLINSPTFKKMVKLQKADIS